MSFYQTRNECSGKMQAITEGPLINKTASSRAAGDDDDARTSVRDIMRSPKRNISFAGLVVFDVRNSRLLRLPHLSACSHSIEGKNTLNSSIELSTILKIGRKRGDERNYIVLSYHESVLVAVSTLF